MAEQTTKRATKKALEAFCTSNNITPEGIMDTLTSLFPDKYIPSEELSQKLLKGLFKAYDEVDGATVTAYLKELDEANKLYSYTEECKVRIEWEGRLNNLLEKVKADAVNKDVRLSDYPEWNTELYNYIRKEYTWNSNFTEDGKYALGKTFYNFFSFWHYDHSYPPFHCYATKDGKDVLFTKDSHRWIESKGCYDFETTSSNGGCLGMVVVFIICSLLVACI